MVPGRVLPGTGAGLVIGPGHPRVFLEPLVPVPVPKQAPTITGRVFLWYGKILGKRVGGNDASRGGGGGRVETAPVRVEVVVVAGCRGNVEVAGSGSRDSAVRVWWC
ncbi:hypothetical protein EDB83DRAFT_2317509 [Lactarius deliciosus]|nr:hypothetical protein EDB83DRAFT_2317509 [Lactarius deliciosus]